MNSACFSCAHYSYFGLFLILCQYISLCMYACFTFVTLVETLCSSRGNKVFPQELQVVTQRVTVM